MTSPTQDSISRFAWQSADELEAQIEQLPVPVPHFAREEFGGRTMIGPGEPGFKEAKQLDDDLHINWQEVFSAHTCAEKTLGQSQETGE